jgi:hypothetical protein
MMEEVEMKKLSQATLVLFLISLFWSCTAMAQDVLRPKMVLKEQSFDFSEVMEGQIVQHTFQVLNEGNQTLLIKSVKPG